MKHQKNYLGVSLEEDEKQTQPSIACPMYELRLWQYIMHRQQRALVSCSLLCHPFVQDDQFPIREEINLEISSLPSGPSCRAICSNAIFSITTAQTFMSKILGEIQKQSLQDTGQNSTPYSLSKGRNCTSSWPNWISMKNGKVCRGISEHSLKMF